MQDVADYEIKDGLLAKKVRLSNGEHHYVPVIPTGGARSIIWNGQKRVLTWRNWILHVLHNSTAGGHVGEHALEQRVLEVRGMQGHQGPTTRRYDLEERTLHGALQSGDGRPRGTARATKRRFQVYPDSDGRVQPLELAGPAEK